MAKEAAASASGLEPIDEDDDDSDDEVGMLGGGAVLLVRWSKVCGGVVGGG
jgi:hypothetical protein